MTIHPFIGYDGDRLPNRNLKSPVLTSAWRKTTAFEIGRRSFRGLSRGGAIPLPALFNPLAYLLHLLGRKLAIHRHDWLVQPGDHTVQLASVRISGDDRGPVGAASQRGLA